MPKPNVLLTVMLGDWIERLRQIPDESVQMCVTSPPYFNLRDYCVDGQLGTENTPEEYVDNLVRGFREVRRVLRKDSTVWINLGDSFENKQLLGIPWKVAFALQSDGWYLRSDIVWHKPNCMPESVTSRPTRAHEYIFLLSKQQQYYYDAEAIKEPASEHDWESRKGRANLNHKLIPTDKVNGIRSDVKYTPNGKDKQRGHSRRHDGFNDRWDAMEKSEQCRSGMRNKRDVWTVSPANFSEFSVSWVWERHDCEATCGNLHIASLNCPIYGGLFDLVSTALCDGHDGGDCSRIARICDRLSLEPKDGFFPIDQLRAWNFGQQRLDSVLLKHFGIASDHNTETHKTGLFVSTSLSCKPSSQRSSRILSILAEHGLSAPHLDMLLNNTWEGDLSENHNIGSLWSIVDSDRLPDFCAAYGINYKKTPRETSHFATFPTKLIEPCILAGSKAGDVVLDPFAGSGTTGEVALTLGRKAVLIELNPDYIKMIEKRCTIQPGFPFAA